MEKIGGRVESPGRPSFLRRGGYSGLDVQRRSSPTPASDHQDFHRHQDVAPRGVGESRLVIPSTVNN